MSALHPVRVCAAATVLWIFAALPASSEVRVESEVATPNGTLAACEKELGRKFFKFLLNSGVVKGGSVAALSYKGFKLSNSLEQKDVTRFLKEHGLSNPKTLRKIGRPVKSFVRGKPFRGGALAGVIVGGGLVVGELLPPEYLPGRGNEPAKEKLDIIVPPPIFEPDSKRDSKQESLGSDTFEQEIIRVAQMKFGDKYQLALLLMTIAELDDGQRAPSSGLRNCARETGDKLLPSVRQRQPLEKELSPRERADLETAILKRELSPAERSALELAILKRELSPAERAALDLAFLKDALSPSDEADFKLARCAQNTPEIICEMKDPRILKVTKGILSKTVYQNGELSWEMSDFQ
jgi:hypothetical protein